MYEVIGTSEMKMDKGTPESLLSNLVASVLQKKCRASVGQTGGYGTGQYGWIT